MQWPSILVKAIGLLGAISLMVLRTFNTQTDYYIKAREVLEIEKRYITKEGDEG